MNAKILFTLCLTTSVLTAANWPAWRNDGHGISSEKNFPVKWTATQNVRWKTELPEPGNSSPIVWGDKLFITQPAGARRTLMCVNRQDGKVLWQSGTEYSENDPTHDTNPFASATPVTDGERVIAWFGSAGIFAYDFTGKELWKRDLGKQTHVWGYGSSPVLYGDLCLLNFGPGKRSFLIALDKKTGKTVWQVDTPELDPPQRFDGFAGKQGQPMGSFSTPLIVKTPARDELVLSLVGELRAFDPKTGKDLWKCDGLNPLIYSSAVVGDGIIVGTGGFSGSSVAVKAGGNGDLSNQKLWYVQREKKNRLSTGVVKNGHLFLANMDGIGECLELATGKSKWNERLKPTGASGEIWGSMVMAGDNIYVVNQSGDTAVIAANPEKFELVAMNPVGERSNSTLALANGEIFLRTHRSLRCISDNASLRAATR